jgi:hypothetical protein
MVGHHYDAMNIQFVPVIVQATVQNNETNGFGKDPLFVSAESNKVRLIVALKMREFAAIKCRHRNHAVERKYELRRDSRPRLSGGAKLRKRGIVAIVCQRKCAKSNLATREFRFGNFGRASLVSTAEGGCAYVVLGRDVVRASFAVW